MSAGLLWSVACASTPTVEGANLTDQPPLPYSVLVAGGGVVEAPSELGSLAASPYARTFAEFDDQLVIESQAVLDALVEARVFTLAAIDSGDPRLGSRLRGARDVMASNDPELVALLTRAREAGHDYVLVVQRLVDGGIEEWGVNDRWPLTTATWLLVGLGFLVQDHTFESRASLEVALYDVEEGRLVYRAYGTGGIVELALTGRGNLWGFVQSIIIPPFLVSSSEELVVESVREATVRRLLSSLTRDLKSLACRRAIAEQARVAIEIDPSGPRLRVRTRAADGLGSVAVRVDGRVLEGERLATFAASLMDSQRDTEHQGLVAEAELELTERARYVQVLVRTVTGVVASTTVELPTR